MFNLPHYPLTREQSLAAADYWDRLAVSEESRLQWDPTALPSIVRTKAALYRQVALEIREKEA